VVAPTDEELSKLAQTLRHPSDPQTRAGSDVNAGATVPPVDTTFRPAAVGDVPGRRRSIGGRAARAFTAALLLAGCTGVAAIAWEFYGDTAEQMIAQWAPQRVLHSLLALEKPALPAQPTAAAVGPATANAAPLAQTAPAGVPPTAVALTPESAQLLQSMARDLASVGQEVEQLKASIEQLKTGQQQMSRDAAKLSEQNLRPRISPRPRSLAARERQPMPTSPPQAAAAPILPQAEPQPLATAPSQADPEFASAPRPPMPVR
jgi:hypothetical protein